MTTHDRIQPVVEFGFTERQARFLVLVMRHAGVCVPRQYARFELSERRARAATNAMILFVREPAERRSRNDHRSGAFE
jgi:hypothetical protein